MLTEPITTITRLTLQDHVDGHCYHWRFIGRRWTWRLLNYFALATVAATLWQGLQYGFRVPMLLIVLGVFYLLYQAPLLRPWLIRWRHRGQTIPEDVISLTFTAELITWVAGPQRVSLRWPNWPVVLNSPKGLLFINRSALPGFWIPQCAFTHHEHRARILQQAAEHGIRVVPIA